MKILYAGDSRGVHPNGTPELPGLDIIQTLNKHWAEKFEIDSFRGAIDCWVFTIFLLEEFLRKKNVTSNYYDLIIIQSGWHEEICWWSPEIFKGLIGKYFDEKKLQNPIIYWKDKTLKYRYYDPDAEKFCLQFIASKCKNLLSIGFHSLKMRTGLDDEFGTPYPNFHHYNALTMNQNYSQMCGNYLHMPMDSNWTNKFLNPDKIHYNESGIQYICNYLNKFIDTMGNTINSKLYNLYSQNKLKNQSIYKNALKFGHQISNVTKKQDVVLIANKTKEFALSAYLGCILFGRTPLYVQRPSSKVSEEEFSKKMHQIKEKLNPTLCVCDENNLEAFSLFNCKTFFDEEVEISESLLKESVSQINSNDVAFIQLSSGTTGDVKILSIRHKEILLHADVYSETINLSENSSVVSWLPLYHDMGLVACFLIPLIKNCSFEIVDPFDWLSSPNKLFEMVENNKATHIWLPNFAFNYLTKNVKNGYDLSSLEKVINCSEQTYLSDMNNFYEKFSTDGLKKDSLSVCYALAENVFAVSQSDSLKTEIIDGIEYMSCGKIIPGVSVIIEKGLQDITNDNKVGNVLIKSSFCKISNSKFYGYYDTGDLGIIKDQELYIISRHKDSFKSFGKFVYPALIEHEVSSLDGVKDGRVVCFDVHNDKLGTNEPWVCFETVENFDDVENLEIEIVKKIKIVFDISVNTLKVDSRFLVKTSSGKICRQRSKQKIFELMNSILNSINEFLVSKNKRKITINETLHTSGLLDSLSMFELMFHLENHNFEFEKKSYVFDETKHNFDSVKNIFKSIIDR